MHHFALLPTGRHTSHAAWHPRLQATRGGCAAVSLAAQPSTSQELLDEPAPATAVHSARRVSFVCLAGCMLA